MHKWEEWRVVKTKGKSAVNNNVNIALNTTETGQLLNDLLCNTWALNINGIPYASCPTNTP
jgi:hypothetical protein